TRLPANTLRSSCWRTMRSTNAGKSIGGMLHESNATERHSLPWVNGWNSFVIRPLSKSGQRELAKSNRLPVARGLMKTEVWIWRGIAFLFLRQLLTKQLLLTG